MRGTKHDASQHQRRGIRSRLIASVAAVAMLATSIAAGTAVAADIDETDPTQQNTIVEQPQQGTENAGDQTGEQNTEPEGDQTDQPQESSDTATETESDTTTEADSNEETDPKTDADKTDNNQSAEKQSAAVPAPLAAESRASKHVNVPDIIENVESTNDKIHVNLFDYDKGTQDTGGVNYERAGNRYTKRSFLFGDETGTINTWTKENGGVRQGIVADDLTELGYPKLADQHGGDDLGYLFNPEGQTTGVNLKGTDVDGLFRQDEDGYYYFDSADNFAKFDEGSNSFKLYEKGRFDNFDTITGAVGHGAFLPFNDLKRDGDNYIYSGDTFDRLHGYRLEGDDRTGDSTNKNSVNYFFGMTVSADFYMPDGRQVDGKDMVFEFEGDDDVWVFVDGKLVLDLGGIHDNYSGSINFTSGEVTVADDNCAGEQDSLGNIFDSLDSLENKTHELKVFYLERGAGGSNCKFRFNLPAVPTSGEDLSVAKAVSGDVDSDATYTMNVLLDGTNLYTGKYQLYTLSGQKVGEEQTANGGAIVMKAGQYATLTDPSITKDTQYVVREVADSARGFQVTATGNGTGDITMSSQPDGSAQSDVLTVSKDSFVTVVNTKPLGEPEHSKKIGDNGDGTYTLALDVIGQNSEETQVTTIPLDIVLVLDASGSMDNDDGHDMGYSYTPVYRVDNRRSYYIDVNGQWTRVQHGNRGWYYGSYPNREYVDYAQYEGDTSNNRVQFYTRSDRQMSRMEALQNAADGFVESVAALNDGIADEGQRHRVAVVKFASDESDSIGNDFTDDYPGYNKSQVVSDLKAYTSQNVSQITTNTIDELYGEGATQADYGLHQAQRVLNGEDGLRGARENAKKVVIFFTDGVPTTFDTWSDSVAGGAINYAHDMKASGALVYSIGVFRDANPNDTNRNFNKYMNAVSSNYPDAECTDGQGNQSNDFTNLVLGDRASGDAEYYFAAKNAEELDAVFEGIQSSITTGASYSNVAIVDELSQWAQVAHPDDFAQHATLTVKKPSGYDGEGNVTGWTEVLSGETGYPSGYRITYTPAPGDDTKTGTVRVDFPGEYKLQNGWRYTLKFDVKPTDAAYQQYANNNGKYPTDSDTDSGQTEGAEGTDLYTDETNTPKDGVSNTSAGKPGFHSNKQAYVEYTSAGKPGKAPYDHPVLQVDVTPVTIGSKFGLQEKKTVIGASAGQGVFGFTVTATGDNAKAAAELAGWTPCTDDQSDRCYVMSDSDKDAVYSFSNPKSITQDEPAVVRSAGEEGGVKFTPDMAGETFTYVYEESGELPPNWHNQSEVPVWTVTATVGFTEDKKALQVTVNVYHGESASDEPADTYVYTSDNPNPTHTAGSTGSSGDSVPTVSFTNTYVAPVSSLPLTGGSSTARTLLLTGGGVLLVAGAAWLLARRRRV